MHLGTLLVDESQSLGNREGKARIRIFFKGCKSEDLHKYYPTRVLVLWVNRHRNTAVAIYIAAAFLYALRPDEGEFICLRDGYKNLLAWY